MGQQRIHRCLQCGYEASVAGGLDSGMRVHVLTITCLDCQELHDVALLERVYSEDSEGSLVERWKQFKLRCPEHAKHRWDMFSGDCPVCRTTLNVEQEPVLLWD